MWYRIVLGVAIVGVILFAFVSLYTTHEQFVFQAKVLSAEPIFGYQIMTLDNGMRIPTSRSVVVGGTYDFYKKLSMLGTLVGYRMVRVD